MLDTGRCGRPQTEGAKTRRSPSLEGSNYDGTPGPAGPFRETDPDGERHCGRCINRDCAERVDGVAIAGLALTRACPSLWPFNPIAVHILVCFLVVVGHT